MPIASDNNYVTIEFQYTAAEDSQIQMRVKFHYVDGSPTISLSQNDQNWLDLPASLFPDVTDHLRQQGLLPQPQNPAYTARTVATGPFRVVQPPKEPSPLPMPQIIGSSQPSFATNQPLESFEHLSALAAKTTVVTGGSSAKMSPEELDAMNARPLLKGAESAIHRRAMSGDGGIKRVE